MKYKFHILSHKYNAFNNNKQNNKEKRSYSDQANNKDLLYPQKYSQ